LLFARVGDLHGPTVRVFASTGNATGIIPGSEVWLGGQRVGLVREVGFRPPASDTAARLLLALDLLEERAHLVRRNARVAIRPGGSFIGAPVVHVDQGTPDAPRLAAGDTLRAASAEFDAIRADLTLAGRELPVILSNVQVLGAQLRSARGTLGALGVGGMGPLAATSDAASALLARAQRGTGTVGATLREGEPLRLARGVAARVDTVRALLASSQTSIGRLRSDSALPSAIAALRADLDAVSAALAEPGGTVGRLRHDERLSRELSRARAELDALAGDVQANPARYLRP
jgi:hypothetical protein